MKFAEQSVGAFMESGEFASAMAEATLQLEQSIAERQRMTTFVLASHLRTALVAKGVPETIVSTAIDSAIEKTWAERGLDTPESGWDPES